MADPEVEALERRRELLRQEIAEFNNRNRLQLFRINLGEGEEYSGNIRFYFLSNGQEVAKVVRLESTTTTEELMPVLVEKYNAYISTDLRHPELFNVVMKTADNEERHLRGNECPLLLTLANGVPPRFILQQSEARRLVKTIGMYSSPLNSRDSLNSIGSGLSVGDRSLTMGSPTFNASQASRSQSSLNDSDSQCSDTSAMTGNMAADLHSPTSPVVSAARSPRKSFIKSFRNTVMKDRKKSSTARPSSPRKKGPVPRVVRSESRRNSAESMGNALRVYSGPALLEQSGSDYKSVVVTEMTTAHSAIQSALTRYHMENEDASDFILCDTVGRLEAYSRQTGHSVDRLSVTDDQDSDVAYRYIVHYSRLVNPGEHPFLLQHNWQPVLDCEQRFVLHPRRHVPAFRPTSPVHGTPSVSSSLDALSEDGTEDEDAVRLTFTQHHSAKTGRVLFNGVLANRVHVPFLVTLTCTREEDSLLMYPLVDKVTTIGRLVASRFSADPGVCIALCDDDLDPVHCQIRCTEYSKAGEVRRNYTLDTVNDCPAAVNGTVVSQMRLLRNGDLVQVGRHHAFVFRDPSASIDSSQRSTTWQWLPKPFSVGEGNSQADMTKGSASSLNSHDVSDTGSLEAVRQHPEGCETPDVAVGNSTKLSPSVARYSTTSTSSAGDMARKPAHAPDLRPSPKSSPPKARRQSDAGTEESSADWPATMHGSNGDVFEGDRPLEKTLTENNLRGTVADEEHARAHSNSTHSNGAGYSNPSTPSTQIQQSVAGQKGERHFRFHFSQTSLAGRGNDTADDTLDDLFCFNLSTEKHEDRFLDIVLRRLQLRDVETPLAPAMAICLSLQQLYKTTEKQTSSQANSRLSRYVNKLTEEVQEVIWQSASRLEAYKEKFVADGDPLEVLEPILPAMRELVTWLANALEILHGVHQLLKLRGEEIGKLSAGPPSSLPTHNTELLESLSLLQEVIVFAFQQVLYPVTKLLYVLLPSVLDENPFEIADKRQKLAKALSRQGYLAMSQVDRLTELLRIVMETLYMSQLHDNISYQLLSNLLFFTNASLFNTLMEDVDFYSWSKGMEIRANLDSLEKWTAEQPVEVREALRHLVQLSMAADLLSLQPEQLLSSTWTGLRGEVAGLDVAQLHRLLQNYQLPEGVERPPAWQPTAEDAKRAKDEKNMLISFASHPPLKIPNTRYALSVLGLPKNDDAIPFLQSIVEQMTSAGLAMTPTGKQGSPLSSPGTNSNSELRSPPVGGESPEMASGRGAQNVDGRSSLSNSLSDGSGAPPRGYNSFNVTAGGSVGGGCSGLAEKPASQDDAGMMASPPSASQGEYLSYSIGSLEAIEEAEEPVSGQNTPAVSRKSSEHLQPSPLLVLRSNSGAGGLVKQESASSLGSLEKTPRGSVILPGGVRVDAASAPRRPSITDVPVVIPSPRLSRAQIVFADGSKYSDSEDEDDDEEEDTIGSPDFLSPRDALTPRNGTPRDTALTPRNDASAPTVSKSPRELTARNASGTSLGKSTSSGSLGDRSASSHSAALTEGMSKSPSMPVIQVDLTASTSSSEPFDAVAEALAAEQESRKSAILQPLNLSHYSASVQSLHDHGIDDLMMRANCLLVGDTTSSGSDMSLNEGTQGGFLSPLAETPDSSSSSSSFSPRKNNNSHGDVVTVTLKKTESGLGLGVVDGKLLGVNPGVYISSLVPALPAHKSGQLQPGDKILAINGANLLEATQDEAYRILRNSGRNVTIVAVRDQHVQQMVSASSC